MISSPLFFGQEITYPPALNIDLNYAYLQSYNNDQLKKFATHFENVDKDKLVILHYGGSHIQAENPTTIARANFHKKYGSGGRGLMFNYSAANTYSSVNYSSSKKGTWKYAKSFQARNTALPLGVCGMTVETNEAFAESAVSNKIAHFGKRSSLLIASHFLKLLVQLLILYWYARLLSLEEYGRYQLVWLVSNLSSVIGLFGLPLTESR